MTATSTELLAGTETVHPYYRLLPSYITTKSVQAERQDFLSRIQETLECLQSLRGGEALDSVLQNRHFRDVDTLFKLKHELPVQLHVQLIRVLVELVWTRDGRCFTDVDMEIRAVKTLHLLLKKWKKRQRDQKAALAGDLVIDWRSVKRAIERVCFRAPGCIQQASQSYLAKLTNTTTKCAEVARSFFQATDPAVPLVMELWTEFGVSIKDVKTTECFRALAFFSFLLSLPSFEGTETEKDVVALLPEWFSVWSLISRCSEWDGHWMKILSRVAKRYPSTSMLDEYLPFIFAKVHDLLELPSDLGSPFKKQLWPSAYTSINGSKRFSQHVMRLCVYLLRDAKDDDRNGTPNQYLFEILSLMKSFFHPSNVANVGNSLATFVYYLSNALSKRLGSEKKNEKGLSAISVCKIVDAILGICLLGIYSKNRGVATKCMYVMKNILCIDPTRCAAPVMEEMLKALDPMAMSHSHLAVTAISSMAVFMYHLMCGQHPHSTGLFFSTYLKPMLKLTLPGIDANDEKKTQATVQLYFHILSWLPLVNDPAKGNFQATKQRGELSNQLFADMKSSLFAEICSLGSQIDEKMWETGPFLEEWTFAVLDRCFQFIQSRSGARSASPNADRSGKSSKRDGSEDAIVLQVLNLLAILYVQMSPEIYTQCLRKTVAFVSSAFYTTAFGGKVISTLIFNCMQGNPSEAIARFMPLVLENFHATKTSIDVVGLMTNEKVWYLQILNGLVRFSHQDDRILLRYQPELKLILAQFLSSDDVKDVYEAAGAVLRHLLSGLVGVYTHDFRSLPAAEWVDATSPNSGAFQYMGIGISQNKLSVKWHEPNEAELSFGFNLLQDHAVGALDELERMRQAKNLNARTWTRLLNQVFQGLCGAANVLTDDSVPEEGALLSGAKLLLLKALESNRDLFKQIASLKSSLMSRVHDIAVFWRENGSKSAMENQVWRLLLDIIHQLLIWRGEHLDEFGIKEAQNLYSRITSLDIASHAHRKAVTAGHSEGKGEHVLALSRNELVEKAMFFYAKRKVQQHFAVASAIMKPESDNETRQRYETLLMDLEWLLTNPYEDVRSNAAGVMKECSVLYARWVYFRQPKQIEELEGFSDAMQLKEEHVSGVLHMLSLPLARRNLWKRRDTLLKRVLLVLLKSNYAIVKQVDSEVSKVKIEVKLQNFFLSLLSNWRYIRGQIVVPPLLDILVAAEPSTTEHWKFQLMHLVMLYLFLQLEEMPISLDTWNLAVRQLGNEVLPVRQIALEVFQQLLKLLKYNRKTGGSADGEALDELIYSDNYARQAKWLALVEATGIHLLGAAALTPDQSLHTLASEFGQRVLSVIREHALAHQYKIIRDRAGKMLFLLGAYAFPTSSLSIGSSSAPIILSGMPLNQLLTASALVGDGIGNEDNVLTETKPAKDTLLHARETAMQWLSCCEKHGDGRDIRAMIDDLLPVALLSQSHPKAEVAVQAKNITDAVSLSLRMCFVPHDSVGERAVTCLLELLKRLSTSKMWKTRGAVLRFTMTFAFYHWIFFSIALKEQVHRLVCAFLTDEQREVQAMAKYALRGLLHNEQQSAVEAMSVRLTESAGQAREKFPKLTRRYERLKDESAPEEELKKIHDRLKALEVKMAESVLSLSAIVLAFPHDVPRFVPPIFEELGRFLYMKRSSNTISFLEKAAKETLLDFKRTHQDNWLETKAEFSQAQLDVIEDVAIAPSYFS
ncbi:hypothetical protein PRNP1_011386 [Phytophthora ramorum]